MAGVLTLCTTSADLSLSSVTAAASLAPFQVGGHDSVNDTAGMGHTPAAKLFRKLKPDTATCTKHNHCHRPLVFQGLTGAYGDTVVALERPEHSGPQRASASDAPMILIDWTTTRTTVRRVPMPQARLLRGIELTTDRHLIHPRLQRRYNYELCFGRSSS